MTTDDLVAHLRVSMVVERLHRAKLTSSTDDRLQNAADTVAARNELARRRRALSSQTSSRGIGR
jgi:hypothetical protein